MKNRLIIIALSAFFGFNVFGQDCVYYFPRIEGAKLVYQNYDKKDKPTGKQSQELVSFSTTASGSKGEIVAKTFDEKDEPLGEAHYTMHCENGVFYFDMMSYVSQETMETYKDMDMVVDASDAELPSNPKVGEKLKDASIKITVNTGIIPIKFSVTLTDRVVDAIESVTTPAGTFETFKINQTNTVNFGFQMVMTSSEWYSKDIGLVKSVTYKNDKPYSSSQLISVTK